ncbi:DNA cross-link repair 1A protein-like isoform X2 [Phlebotomus argentipes]|uniref:DNA cross-link repair 1A protein-like isoform X2 n=1 Tax=Phlebotomus argentipes TaxID=94469 RepID=UPI002892E323|nr:DNA cross-link repair 1A protein-like isoform X2 [Phlebotomus argentipes]
MKGRIHVKPLAVLQEPDLSGNQDTVAPGDLEDNVIVLSSDGEDVTESTVPPLSLRRRKRRKEVLLKIEEEDSVAQLNESQPQSGRKSRKQQQLKSIASKCYRIQDFFSPAAKDEVKCQEVVQKMIVDEEVQQPKEMKENRDDDATLRQFSSTRARNPVTNIFVRRTLGRSTNLKMIGKKYFTDKQKRIQNYFAVHRGSTFRSYYETFRESLFPVMISGDINVNNFLSKLLEITATAEQELLFNFSLQKDQIVVRPKKGCCFADEAQLMDLLERTIKQEGDVEVNPECQTINRVSTSGDSGITEPPENHPPENHPPAIKEEQPKKPRRGRKVVCPPFKIVKGTTFAVDAFRYGIVDRVTHYFLTHFHADHYVGLRKSFDRPIYLTAVTANLVRAFIGVHERHLHEMELNTPITIDGVEVTAIDANHCPGAAMFFFKLPSGETVLHTGDFRASYAMEMHPIFWNNDVDTIYLDTTYLSSRTVLPSQEESIQSAVEATQTFLTRNIGEKTLVIVGTYVVGKENVWRTLATHFRLRVWLEAQRRRAVEALGDADLLRLLCEDPRDAQLHVLPLAQLNYDYVVKYVSQFEHEFTHALALRPSGWEVNSRPRHQGRVSLVGVTYSEHSSYVELRRFVRFLRPREVIPTVNPGGDRVPAKWLSRGVEPWREGQQSAITNFFPIKQKTARRRQEFDGEANLTQFSVAAQCDPADLAATDWTL